MAATAVGPWTSFSFLSCWRRHHHLHHVEWQALDMSVCFPSCSLFALLILAALSPLHASATPHALSVTPSPAWYVEQPARPRRACPANPPAQVWR
jgi:hypothetical protein